MFLTSQAHENMEQYDEALFICIFFYESFAEAWVQNIAELI